MTDPDRHAALEAPDEPKEPTTVGAMIAQEMAKKLESCGMSPRLAGILSKVMGDAFDGPVHVVERDAAVAIVVSRRERSSRRALPRAGRSSKPKR